MIKKEDRKKEKLVNIVIPSAYYDSVVLMRASSFLTGLRGILRASIMMGSEANKGVLSESRMLDEEGRKAGASDLIISFVTDGSANIEEVRETVRDYLDKKRGFESDFNTTDSDEYAPRSVRGALELNKDLNLLLISVPGEYASWEAEFALENGLSVMIFSDNVPLEEEVRLKKLARKKGLIVMGPDCGTAILNGVALGFANVVKRGPVGIVGASGTGIQELSSILSNSGTGISQAIGTGGRDLREEVGGLSMLTGIEVLAKDPATSIIALISKPPGLRVARKIFRKILTVGKPAVACFIGEKISAPVPCFQTMEETAREILRILGRSGEEINKIIPSLEEQKRRFSELTGKISRRGNSITGLYSGGTLCQEALLIFKNHGLKVNSNLLKGEGHLGKGERKEGHNLIDFGDDEYTVGTPHPMIDYTVRIKELMNEIERPEVGVILFDVVLGYGSHMDPAGVLLPALKEARKKSVSPPVFVASVTGTDEDPQNRRKQIQKLSEAGVYVFETSAMASRFAMAVACDNKF